MNALIIFLVAFVGLILFFGCLLGASYNFKNDILNFIKNMILTCIIFLDFGIIIGTIERLV